MFTCLSFGHTVLYCLQDITTGERPPGTRSMCFNDYIGVHEDGAGMTWHAPSQFNRGVDPVACEQIHEPFNGQIQQTGSAAGRHPAVSDRQSNDFHKRF